MGRWGAERGFLRHLTHLPTTAAGHSAASFDQGPKAQRGPERGRGWGGKGEHETRRTAAELGVGSGQRRDRLELTQIRAQNDRDPEALATYGRK